MLAIPEFRRDENVFPFADTFSEALRESFTHLSLVAINVGTVYVPVTDAKSFLYGSSDFPRLRKPRPAREIRMYKALFAPRPSLYRLVLIRPLRVAAPMAYPNPKAGILAPVFRRTPATLADILL
jgi:hypothetical protein